MNKCDLPALITALGGRQALQDLLGVGASAVSNYLARGELPRHAHAPVCAALESRGYHVDPGSLAIIGRGDGARHSRRRVLLIVGGGIAAYKALEVARRLQDHDIAVTGVMTAGAREFITPLSLSALTGEKAYTDLFSLTDEAEMGHIRLAREADLVLVAPATANLMARAANGLADDLATTILLATTAPVLMAPAMNPAMWSHAATQENLARLQARGIAFVGPGAGDMACGEEGTGRLSEPEIIVEAALASLSRGEGPLAGRHAVVTSGPTVEPIDAVRFIANRSSGKQGHAIAAALAGRGARVTLVSGPVTLPPPPNVELVPVQTAQEMLAACEAALAGRSCRLCRRRRRLAGQRCDKRQDQESGKRRHAASGTDGESRHPAAPVKPRIPPTPCRRLCRRGREPQGKRHGEAGAKGMRLDRRQCRHRHRWWQRLRKRQQQRHADYRQ